MSIFCLNIGGQLCFSILKRGYCDRVTFFFSEFFGQDRRVPMNENPISFGYDANQPFGMTNCGFCGQRVMDKHQLATHIAQVHSNEMPFYCQICRKGYFTSSGLKRHMITHEKQFLCRVCDSKFTQKSSMERHLKSVHKSSQCPICSKIIKLGPSFDQHIKECFKTVGPN